MPIQSLGRTPTVLTIPAGGSVSEPFDLSSSALLGFLFPASWSTAAFNIEVSLDNVTWASGVLSSSGVSVSSWPTPSVGVAYNLDAISFIPWRYVRVRSGTLAAPVTQAEARRITLTTRVLN